MNYLIGYVATLVAFCALDFAWLGWIAKGFYQSQVGAVLLAQPNWTAAMMFYFLYSAGMQIFCVAPALDSGSALEAAALGALFGFFCYMTYDLSNLATLKGWSARLSLVDVLWGAAVTAASSAAGCAAAQLVARH